MNSVMRRSKKEIALALVEFLEKQEKPFFKSNLEEIKMSSKTAEEWLDIYEIFNKGPKIRKIEMEKNVVYEVLRKRNGKEDFIPFQRKMLTF